MQRQSLRCAARRAAIADAPDLTFAAAKSVLPVWPRADVLRRIMGSDWKRCVRARSSTLTRAASACRSAPARLSPLLTCAGASATSSGRTSCERCPVDACCRALNLFSRPPTSFSAHLHYSRCIYALSAVHSFHSSLQCVGAFPLGAPYSDRRDAVARSSIPFPRLRLVVRSFQPCALPSSSSRAPRWSPRRSRLLRMSLSTVVSRSRAVR